MTHELYVDRKWEISAFRMRLAGTVYGVIGSTMTVFFLYAGISGTLVGRPISDALRGGLVVGGIALPIVVGWGVWVFWTRRRLPLVVAEEGIFLSEVVLGSSRKTRGDLVRWEEVESLDFEDFWRSGGKVVVFRIKVRTVSGEEKEAFCSGDPALREIVQTSRKNLPRGSAEARI